MALVYLGLGSNLEREKHLCNALDALQTQFGRLRISKIYESESVGFEGDHFYNLAVGIETQLSVGTLSRALKEIEDKNGRDRSAPRFSGRTLDIDILTYDDHTGTIDGVELPRNEITKNAFVLLPLVDIAPHATLPGSDKSYTQLWANYDQNKQRLWAVNMQWHDQTL